jgi:N-methylhydantoinase B
MPASVRVAIEQCGPFSPGDVVILNDPFLGGTHLPDVTLVSPLFAEPAESPQFFVASRAHHADIGGITPGSMPLSVELFQEGLIIPPIKLVEAGALNEAVWKLILRNVRTPEERAGDLAAQMAAHNTGALRLAEIVTRYGLNEVLAHAQALIAYAQRLTEQAVDRIPDGRYSNMDWLDDDGQERNPVPIQVEIVVSGRQMLVDFTGTAGALRGNLNAVPAIVHSATVYCLRCLALELLGIPLPMNEGAFAPLTFRIPPGSVLDPRPPHAVAAGNVETSQRIVDVIFGALAQALPEHVPAASQGTMNNLTFGGVYESGESAGQPFAYYETVGGGIGAGPNTAGGDGMHSHMSNTLNTPVEALEYAFPLRMRSYRLRRDSGGSGKHRGGDGLVRSIEFLQPVSITIVSERRRRGPYGLQRGKPGKAGINLLHRQARTIGLPGKVARNLETGDILHIETPGGGGWGRREGTDDHRG